VFDPVAVKEAMVAVKEVVADSVMKALRAKIFHIFLSIYFVE
jgi:hypothetical protein